MTLRVVEQWKIVAVLRRCEICGERKLIECFPHVEQWVGRKDGPHQKTCGACRRAQYDAAYQARIRGLA